MGSKLYKGLQALGMSELCSRQLAGDRCKVVPQSTCHLNGARPCGAMKMTKSCEEVVAAKQRTLGQKVADSKLGASKDFSLQNLH